MKKVSFLSIFWMIAFVGCAYADSTISNLDELTAADSADEMIIVDDSAGATKKITKANLFASPDPIGSTTPSTGAFTTVGIGTTTVPHGGVGAAKLAIDGASPQNIQISTTTDDYPIFQFRASAHDGASIGLDCYFDGSWKSSDAGSNFLLLKASDTFTTYYDSGVAQGGAVTWNTGISLDTSGKLGIGTSTVPHGGVGAAQVAIDGATPFLQITTTADNYPVLGFRPAAHDAVGLLFDCYHDGAWKSSDAGSNFLLLKSSDLLTFYYDAAVAQGGAIGWNTGITLNASGIVFMPAVAVHDLAGDDNETALYIDPDDGEMGYNSSIAASKINIQNLTDSSWIYALTPRKYNRRVKLSDAHWDESGEVRKFVPAKYSNTEFTQATEMGLIAEEVYGVKPELTFSVDGKLMGVNLEKLIVPILVEMQKLKAEIEQLKAQK